MSSTTGTASSGETPLLKTTTQTRFAVGYTETKEGKKSEPVENNGGSDSPQEDEDKQGGGFITTW